MAFPAAPAAALLLEPPTPPIAVSPRVKNPAVLPLTMLLKSMLLKNTEAPAPPVAPEAPAPPAPPVPLAETATVPAVVLNP